MKSGLYPFDPIYLDNRGTMNANEFFRIQTCLETAHSLPHEARRRSNPLSSQRLVVDNKGAQTEVNHIR